MNEPSLMTQGFEPPPADAMLRVENAGLHYATAGGAVTALDDVSLNVREGEFVSIVGPSGCGKSSLLKMILGLVPATKGSIYLDGEKIKRPSSGVGVVFQSPVLLPWRTIGSNVLLPIDIMGLDREVATNRARSLLKMVGLSEFENRYPFELSGGMQQRAAIVRALVHDPRLLIMDEPFAALDAMTRERMALDLQRIWIESGKTIVFITHSIQEAVFLSNRIYVMSSRPGTIVATFENREEMPRTFAHISKPAVADMITAIRSSLDAHHVI